MAEKKQSGLIDTLKILAHKVDFNNLTKYSKFNLFSTCVIAVVVVLLAIQPILAMVESMIVSLGNVFIRIFTNNEIISRTDTSMGTLVLNIGVVLLEGILCKIFCYFADKLNLQK